MAELNGVERFVARVGDLYADNGRYSYEYTGTSGSPTRGSDLYSILQSSLENGLALYIEGPWIVNMLEAIERGNGRFLNSDQAALEQPNVSHPKNEALRLLGEKGFEPRDKRAQILLKETACNKTQTNFAQGMTLALAGESPGMGFAAAAGSLNYLSNVDNGALLKFYSSVLYRSNEALNVKNVEATVCR